MNGCVRVRARSKTCRHHCQFFWLADFDSRSQSSAGIYAYQLGSSNRNFKQNSFDSPKMAPSVALAITCRVPTVESLCSLCCARSLCCPAHIIVIRKLELRRAAGGANGQPHSQLRSSTASQRRRPRVLASSIVLFELLMLSALRCRAKSQPAAAYLQRMLCYY